MATVTPGTLRPEGPGFRPSRDVKRLVETTNITDFGDDEFGVDVSFVVTQTDAPATDTRTRGTLWFKRGEGRLYRWDNAWTHSDESGLSDGAFWIAMSDRREMVAYYTGTIQDQNDPTEPAGANLAFFGGPGTAGAGTTVTNGNGVKRIIPGVGILSQFSTKRAPPLTTQSFAAGDYFTVVDIGYCDALVNSGVTGPGFGAAKTDSTAYLINAETPYTTDQCYWAHIVQSAPSFAAERVKVFCYSSGRRFGTNA